MSLAIRSVLFVLILSWTTSAGLAQNHRGRNDGGRPVPPMAWGSAGVTSFGLRSPLGYGFAMGGSFGTGPGYQPGRLGFGFSSGGIAFGAPVAVVPPGQEGPGGLMLPHPGAANPATPVTPTPRRGNSDRAQELTDIGDRSFRGGNYRRAEEKYQLAAKANQDSPVPHVHLAQIAMVRKDYSTAARHLRNAVGATNGSGWLLEAPDIQSMYGEPGDFSRQVGHLESYLQTHPGDRNAWFVLGAEQYFSGHAQAASDAFIRLGDRAPDPALTAFVDASTVAKRASALNHPAEP